MASEDGVIPIKDDTFEQTIASGVTLIDFWADWCMPCRMQAPIMEQLAEELRDRATVGKMDVDSNPHTPSRFGITGIPTCILFKDGQEVRRFVGVQSKQTLSRALQEQL